MLHYLFTGDSLDYHRNQKFTTFDVDNDNLDINCAQTQYGGWWFNECDYSNLNGQYGINSDEGVEWYLWVESRFSLKKAEMKIKPFM
jgi:hypothetical protein